MVISFCAATWYSLKEGTVKNIFFHDCGGERVYTELPREQPQKKENTKMYRTQASINGLKRAPHVWNLKLQETIEFLSCSIEIGLKSGSMMK